MSEEEKKPSNKRFFVVCFALMMAILGVVYVATKDDEATPDAPPAAPADQGIHL